MILWNTLPTFVYIPYNSLFQVGLRDSLTENSITIQLNVKDSFFDVAKKTKSHLGETYEPHIGPS